MSYIEGEFVPLQTVTPPSTCVYAEPAGLNFTSINPITQITHVLLNTETIGFNPAVSGFYIALVSNVGSLTNVNWKFINYSSTNQYLIELPIQSSYSNLYDLSLTFKTTTATERVCILNFTLGYVYHENIIEPPPNGNGNGNGNADNVGLGIICSLFLIFLFAVMIAYLGSKI